MLEHADAFECLLGLLPEDPEDKSKETTDDVTSKRRNKKLAKRKAKKQQKKQDEGESTDTKNIEESTLIKEKEKIVIYDDEGDAVAAYSESEDELDHSTSKKSPKPSAKKEVEEQPKTEKPNTSKTQKKASTKSKESNDKKSLDNDKEEEGKDVENDTEHSVPIEKSDPKKLEELREKIASKLQEFKSKRKAPGTVTNGTVRTREAILAARREKDRISKEKAQLKRKREENDDGHNEENEYEDASDDDVDTSNLMYSSVEFADGTKATANLKEMRHQKSKKGPRDILGQLKHVEARQAKIAKMDDEKRADIEEKNKWGKAIAQAEGAKVRDDVKKLKASLKRHTNKKLKSEKEWNERKEKASKDKADKIQKRNENIALKIERGKIHGKKARKRAGFEGGIAKARARRIKQASDPKNKGKGKK